MSSQNYSEATNAYPNGLKVNDMGLQNTNGMEKMLSMIWFIVGMSLQSIA